MCWCFIPQFLHPLPPPDLYKLSLAVEPVPKADEERVLARLAYVGWGTGSRSSTSLTIFAARRMEMEAGVTSDGSAPPSPAGLTASSPGGPPERKSSNDLKPPSASGRKDSFTF